MHESIDAQLPMNDREGTVASWTIVLMLVLWLGFFVHRSPRFAGSLAGGALGVAAALSMIVPLVYSLMKRSTYWRARLSARLPLARALAIHAYAGLLGSILAILHTGHRFQSWLGIALTAAMLVTVTSGFVGRHLVRYVAQDLRERRDRLVALQREYDALAARAIGAEGQALRASPWSSLRRSLGRAIAGSAPASGQPDLYSVASEVSSGIAELEYAIGADETIRKRLSVWLGVHLAVSIAFYGMLALHIASGINYGLRWWGLP